MHDTTIRDPPRILAHPSSNANHNGQQSPQTVKAPFRTLMFLWCLMSVHSGTLTSRSVHPASPVLLTKNGPLVTVHSNVHVQLSNKDFLHI